MEEDGHRVLRVDVRRRRELDDPGAEPLGRVASGLQAVEDVGLGAGRLGAAGDGDAQPFERARPVARAQGQRGDDRVGVAAGLGGQRAQQRGRVGDAAGHRAGVVERRAQRDAAVVGDAAVGRLDRGDARQRGRDAQRAGGVGAHRRRDHARRQGRGRAAARPAGRAVERPRVADLVGGPAGGELVRVAVARRGPCRGRAGAATPRCRRRRRCPRARGWTPSAPARAREEVLERQRDPAHAAGPRRPRWPAARRRPAPARAASSGYRRTHALMAPGAPSKVGAPPLRAAIRAWHAASSSTADSARARRSAAASRRPRSAGSVAPGSVTAGRRGSLQRSSSRAAWPRRRRATFSRQTSCGRRRQHLVPDLGHAARQLRRGPPGRAMNHQCRCAAPSPQRPMWTRADLADREHRALDAAEHDALLSREVVREVGRAVVMSARLEDHDDRQAARLEGHQPPVLVRPEVLAVGLGAGRAVDAALAVTPGSGSGARERSRAQRGPRTARSPTPATGGRAQARRPRGRGSRGRSPASSGS